MDEAAATMLQKVGGKLGDHDVGLVDAVSRQTDFRRLVADKPAGLGNLTAIGDGGEHLFPTRQDHRGALPWRRFDLEFIRQAFGAAHPEP